MARVGGVGGVAAVVVVVVVVVVAGAGSGADEGSDFVVFEERGLSFGLERVYFVVMRVWGVGCVSILAGDVVGMGIEVERGFYSCGSGFEEEGGLGEPRLSGGEVGHFWICV